MKRKIRSILEELYESYPSLKEKEQSLIPIIDAFLKINVSVFPDVIFKRELKKKLLQSISHPSRFSLVERWKNVRLWFSLFATGLVMFGIFSFYYLQIRPLNDQFIPVQPETVGGSSSTTSVFLGDQNKSVSKKGKEDSLEIQSGQGDENPVFSSTHQENQSFQNTGNTSLLSNDDGKKSSHQTEKKPSIQEAQPKLPPQKNSSPTDSSTSSSFQNFSNISPVPPVSLGLGEGFQGENDETIGGDSFRMFSQKMGGASPYGIISSGDGNENSKNFLYKIQGGQDIFTDADTQVFISQKIKIPSSGDYTVLSDDLETSFSLMSNTKRNFGSIVSIDAKDIPSPQQVVDQFYAFMLDFGIFLKNIDFTVDNAKITLSEIFDETVVFSVPYTLQGREVYDESGEKVSLGITYNFIRKDFEFVGPIYHFESTISQASVSELFHSPMPKIDDGSVGIIELKKGKPVFIKVLVNGRYEFVPGYKYFVVSKPKDYTGGESFVYPNLGGTEYPIQIEE